MTDKLAEEILAKFIEKLDCTYRYKTINERKNIINELRYLMQAYHEAKMKEVTDADIVKYAFNCYPDSYNMRVACVNGARDMRNGEIKHNG